MVGRNALSPRSPAGPSVDATAPTAPAVPGHAAWPSGPSRSWAALALCGGRPARARDQTAPPKRRFASSASGTRHPAQRHRRPVRRPLRRRPRARSAHAWPPVCGPPRDQPVVGVSSGAGWGPGRSTPHPRGPSGSAATVESSPSPSAPAMRPQRRFTPAQQPERCRQRDGHDREPQGRMWSPTTLPGSRAGRLPRAAAPGALDMMQVEWRPEIRGREAHRTPQPVRGHLRPTVAAVHQGPAGVTTTSVTGSRTRMPAASACPSK